MQDKVYDEFASKFAAAVDKQMTVGNGMEASSTQGPLINEKAVQKVQYSWLDLTFGSLLFQQSLNVIL